MRLHGALVVGRSFSGQHPMTSRDYTVRTTVTFVEHGLAPRSRT
ncbi:hypothetical protein [Streptomyces sp. OV198]|nr:hypothetical protein [Streptomyces sp. OV198]